MKSSDYIINALFDRGVTHIFEIIGGMITHLVDFAHRHGKIKLVSVHHEQAAAFAAHGFGMMKGVPGVALATSGPGATNLLTGIGSCYFDSIPSIFITGQVNLNEQKGIRAIRQLGFQETDIVSMARPITKAAWMIQSAEQIPAALDEAFHLCLSGRPGPILLDIPMDLQRTDLPDQDVLPLTVPAPAFTDFDGLQAFIAALKKVQRPLILAGGGITASHSSHMLRELVEHIQVPVVNSLQAVDALPTAHPLHIGLIGSYGNRWANLALGACDLLLVLGSRLDIRQTGADIQSFQSGRIIIHVDCDPNEINNRIKECRPIISDLSAFLEAAVVAARLTHAADFSPWLREIRALQTKWPDTTEVQGFRGINPNIFMHALSAASTQATAFTVDVGNHQMWAAQSLELQSHQRFITSSGMGAMGFSLPAAVGACFASPGLPVVQIAGDGGMQLNIQELQTIVHHRLPIKMVVINNQSYGMVRQFQQSYFHERYPSTSLGYSAPDFAKVARAYGIRAYTIEMGEESAATGLAQLWQDPLEPFLLQVRIDPLINAYPKIAFGYPLTQMEPFTRPLDMEGT